jgi:hypothetical protein
MDFQIYVQKKSDSILRTATRVAKITESLVYNDLLTEIQMLVDNK